RSCSFRSSWFVFPRSGRHRESGHHRVAPLATAARAGRNGCRNESNGQTNTNGYPYPSCVPIVDSEEPFFMLRGGRPQRLDAGEAMTRYQGSSLGTVISAIALVVVALACRPATRGPSVGASADAVVPPTPLVLELQQGERRIRR